MDFKLKLTNGNINRLVAEIKKQGIDNFIAKLPSKNKEWLINYALVAKLVKRQETKISQALVDRPAIINAYVNALNPPSQRLFTWGLKKYQQWLSKANIAFLDADRVLALKYFAFAKTNLKVNSCRRLLFVVKRIYDEFVLRGAITANPFAKLPPLKAEWKPRPVGEYTPANIALLLKAAWSANHHQLIKAIGVCLNYGLRWNELATFEVNSHFVRWTGKGNKPRTAPLTPEIKDNLKIVGSNTYFKTYWPTPPDPRSLRRQFALAAKKAGLKWTPHDLRHYFARQLFAKTKDIQAVKKALGHASISTTDIYLNREY